MLRRLVLLAILAAIGGLVFVQWRSNSGFFANPPSPEPPKIASPQLPTPQQGHADSQAKPQGSSAPEESAKHAASDASNATAASDDEDHAGAGSRESHKKSADTTSDRSPSAALLRAQDYLLGRGGVKQNCEQGLIYLRAATKANEPAAAVQMGALYASGHCVTRDRVMAYRWFNSAHELEPDDPEIRSDLQQLWGEMTAQERRQASR
jgi:TPR repeat protein